MALTVNSNISSISTQNALRRTETGLNKAMRSLSTGLRINMAADDAAGLAISEKLKSQVRSLGQSQRNANDAISMLQTAEGALNETNSMLIRMRELSIQAANGTLGTSERDALNDEFTALRSEINRIANVTEFNDQKLVNGNLSGGVTFQVGTENTANDKISISMLDSTASTLGITGSLSISTVSGAQGALSLIDTAITAVTDRRGTIGSVQNRLLNTINNLSSTVENLAAANSRILDADIAMESANFAKEQIRMQAGIAMLANGNQMPGLALALIG